MSDQNKTSTQNQNVNPEQKPGMFARAKAWVSNAALDNPIKSTVLISGVTFGGIKAAGWGIEKGKEYFAEKAAEPAKEQAAALVGGLARGFTKRF